MSTRAHIALGSNLGDRQENLTRALAELRAHPQVRVVRVSSFHETVPVGGPAGQGLFLNAAAELETDLDPAALLQLLLDVEQRLGRQRTVKDGPRTLDLDLLLYGDLVRPSPDPVVPHPRMQERQFVLEPLAEIAADVVHPALGKTVRELRDALRGPSRELAGKRAVVTGSTSGIGRAIALELAAAGADVIVHGRRSQEQAEEVAGLITARGVRARALLADLRDPTGCQRLFEFTKAEWKGADIWVNNAGADILTGEAARWPFERKLEELLTVDVTATMVLSRVVGQWMKTTGGGVILTIGWDQADTGMEGDSGQLFAAAKAAVMAFTKSLAKTLAPEVRVNCIAPGWVRTAWGENAPSQWQERAVRETPLGRWGTPEDIAGAVRWLVSPAAAFVTGQVINVNGGAVC